MFCPLYVDQNTSNFIFTHIMGPLVVFTRYDQCFGPDTAEDAEGSWTSARGRLTTNATNEIRVDFGFHEKGTIKANAIAWTNQAEWTVPVMPFYEGLDSQRVYSLKTTDRASWSVTVRNNSENTTVGVMHQFCQDVFLGNRKGTIKGNIIGWDDGDIWWGASSLIDIEMKEDDWTLFPSPYPDPDSYDYYTYEHNDWWSEYRERRSRRLM
jgi:hypothetical protein